MAAGNANNPNVLLEGIDEDSYCTICWVSGLGSEPCIKLGCRHVFHIKCVRQLLENKWTSPRIVFSFLNCPSCKTPMDLDHCPQLIGELAKVKAIKLLVEKKAVERAKLEGIDRHERLQDPNDRFYRDL